jgi:hypothetical protein
MPYHLQQCSVYELDKVCLTSELKLLFFSNPTYKTQLQIGGELVIATHLDQSNYLANQK